MKKSLLQFLILIVICLSNQACTDKHGNSIFSPNRIEPPSIEEHIARAHAINLGRSSWQKPELIVRKLGNVRGQTIADIGSGTGYFTFHLAHLGAKMIAIDIDPLMIRYIDTNKNKLPSHLSEQISTRLALPDDPKLRNGEVDKALIINTISYIDNLDKYLTTLKPGIASGGELVIVDYKRGKLGIPSPPEESLVGVDKLTSYLEQAGYKNIVVDEVSLLYQYIVTAVCE